VDESLHGSVEKRPPAPGWTYFGFILAVSALLLLFLGFIHVRGAYTFPPGFSIFRRLFYVQYALFVGAVLAALLDLFQPDRVHWLGRRCAFAVFYFCFLWIVLWSLVHRTFGIELTPGFVIDIITNRAPISEMGVTSAELAVTLTASFALAVLLSLTTDLLTRRYDGSVRRRGWLIFMGLFVLVHVPVRAFFVYHLDHNDYATLAYDDCVPFSLRTERLLPWSRSDRTTLPNLASTSRTKQYLDYLRVNRPPPIPRRHNIVWFNIESLRFDAITAQTMPHLWAERDKFQIRLDRQHWSDANATHFAIFSMLTGLSGYHVPALRAANLSDPFLVLLRDNGYRLRVAKRAHIESADLFGLVPPETILAEIDMREDRGDRQMVDRYLEDRSHRGSPPSFDFLALDATHWPYFFPETDAVFQPISRLTSANHILLSGQDLELIRNNYRNACHFVDAQISRVMEDLNARGELANTIIVLLGDHGEEFEERGQMTHTAVFNDYQGRTVLWMHLPDLPPNELPINVPTVHLDVVPTILQSLGYTEDVLYTQGRSLLSPVENRPMLSLCEQGGVAVPLYRALVTANYVSRWRYAPAQYLFSGVQRRDGTPVKGEDWRNEARALYDDSARMYEILPDTSQPPRKFGAP
jgi:membrane-anchored protein YejM (alkaline phosphatase superfamily)